MGITCVVRRFYLLKLWRKLYGCCFLLNSIYFTYFININCPLINHANLFFGKILEVESMVPGRVESHVLTGLPHA